MRQRIIRKHRGLNKWDQDLSEKVLFEGTQRDASTFQQFYRREL